MTKDKPSAVADRRPPSLSCAAGEGRAAGGAGGGVRETAAFWRSVSRGVPLLLLAALAACAGAPPPRLFLLSNEVAVPASPAGTQRPLLVVRNVAVPEYLDRRAILYRSTEAELKRFPDVIWAERLNESLTRWVALQLAADLPAYEVEAYAASNDKTPAVALYLSLQTFEPDATGSGGAILRLRGTWHLGGSSAAEGRVSADVPMAALDAPSTVAAMRAALVQVTDSIAARLR